MISYISSKATNSMITLGFSGSQTIIADQYDAQTFRPHLRRSSNHETALSRQSLRCFSTRKESFRGGFHAFGDVSSRYSIPISVTWLLHAPKMSEGFLLFLGSETPFIGSIFAVPRGILGLEVLLEMAIPWPFQVISS